MTYLTKTIICSCFHLLLLLFGPKRKGNKKGGPVSVTRFESLFLRPLIRSKQQSMELLLPLNEGNRENPMPLLAKTFDKRRHTLLHRQNEPNRCARLT